MTTESTGATRPAAQRRSTSVHISRPEHLLQPVPDPDEKYYRCIGQFDLFEADDDVATGTGTLIDVGGKMVILTCAHNLCYDGTNRLIEKADFTPAQRAGGSPYTTIRVERSQMWISPRYVDIPDDLSRYDVGIVRLDPATLPPDWSALPPRPTMWSMELADGIVIQVTGYPAETDDNGTMYFSTGTCQPASVVDGFIKYDASAEEGSSGSGVCLEANLDRITAVHVGGSPSEQLNYGVYLSPEIIAEITKVLSF